MSDNELVGLTAATSTAVSRQWFHITSMRAE